MVVHALRLAHHEDQEANNKNDWNDEERDVHNCAKNIGVVFDLDRDFAFVDNLFEALLLQSAGAILARDHDLWQIDIVFGGNFQIIASDLDFFELFFFGVAKNLGDGAFFVFTIAVTGEASEDCAA